MDLSSWAVVIPSNREVLASRLAAIPAGVAIYVVEDGDAPVDVSRSDVRVFSKESQRRFMGRDYDAAVMASGFVGFMLGTTANALGKPVRSVTLLGYTGTLTWKQEPDAFVVTLPNTSAFRTALGFKIETK